MKVLVGRGNLLQRQLHLPRAATAAMLAAALMIVAVGCTSLAERVAIPGAAAPALGPVQAVIERDMGITNHSTRIADDLTLAWRLVPAADRGFGVAFAPDGRSFTMGPESTRAPVPLRTRGTIVYLHGWGMDSSTMLFWAMAMADHGYRGISVDLRSHGGSSKAPVGYGTREAADVAALLDRLDAAGQLEGPVHLLGVSYGATTALMAEASLRNRVSGIVAIGPFANAAEAARNAMHSTLSMTGASLRSRIVLGAMRLRYAGADLDAAIREAGILLGLDLASIDAASATRDSQTCTLLLHGAEDTFVPPDASRRLALTSPRMRLHLMERENHFSLPFRIDLLERPLLRWLESVETGGCPGFELLPRPEQAVAGVDH